MYALRATIIVGLVLVGGLALAELVIWLLTPINTAMMDAVKEVTAIGI